MEHIDREKAQRLIERMEALAKEENVNIQKIAECGQIVLRREKDLKQLMSAKPAKHGLQARRRFIAVSAINPSTKSQR